MRPSKRRMRDNSSGGSTTDTESDSDSDKEFLNPSDCGPFSEEERVLAYHSNHIYAAKVMKVECHMKQWRYKVHYLGWNKSWDEWVGVESLMKFTEENVRKQKELQEKDKDKGTKPGRGTLVKPKTFGTRGKKRNNGSVTKEKGHVPLGKHMSIHIPLTLKKQLVDDCESITHLGKFIKLPRSPDGSTSDLVGELREGLHIYFNKTLPVFLLYKSELKKEYQTTCHLPPLKLPELLDNAQIEKETLMEMLPMLNDFLKFLQKNQSTFFLSTYRENTAGIDKYD